MRCLQKLFQEAINCCEGILERHCTWLADSCFVVMSLHQMLQEMLNDSAESCVSYHGMSMVSLLCTFSCFTALHKVQVSCAGFKTGICGAAPLHNKVSLLALSNNTCIAGTLTSAYHRFMHLYRVRAHMHHYTEFIDRWRVSRVSE